MENNQKNVVVQIFKNGDQKLISPYSDELTWKILELEMIALKERLGY